MEPLLERTFNPLPQFATLLQFESQEYLTYLGVFHKPQVYDIYDTECGIHHRLESCDLIFTVCKNYWKLHDMSSECA